MAHDLGVDIQDVAALAKGDPEAVARVADRLDINKDVVSALVAVLRKVSALC